MTFTLPAAPALMTAVGGPQRAMVLGSAGYTLYLASMIYLNEVLVLLASVVIGMSGALLWTGQGAYLLANTTAANNGQLAGVFWAMMMMSNVLGNTSASALMRATKGSDDKAKNVCTDPPSAGGGAKAFSPGWNGTDSELFILLAGVSAVGVVVLSCLPGDRQPVVPLASIPSQSSADGADVTSSEPAPEPISARARLRATLRMLTKPSMAMLSPLFFYTGIGVTFYAGQFTRQICAQADIGFIMTMLGVAETVGSMVFGRLADAVGSTVVLTISAVLQVGALAVVWEANTAQGGLLYLAAVLLGLADCGFQTQMYKVLGDLWEDKRESEEAYAAFKFLQTVACTCGFLYAPLLVTPPQKTSSAVQLRSEIAICGGFLALGMLGLGAQRLYAARALADNGGAKMQGLRYAKVRSGSSEEDG